MDDRYEMIDFAIYLTVFEMAGIIVVMQTRTNHTGRRLAIVLLSCVLLTAGLAKPAIAGTPVQGKYLTSAYIAASRSSAAVYVNALVKQDSALGIVRSPGRTVYLQRELQGSWQNMLSRTTNSQGQFAVGFISVPNYTYRLVVLASSTAWPGRSATVTTTTPVASTCGAPANPYGYNFCGRGTLIYQPATGICSYFSCIGNFWNGVGYLIQCRDATFSMSGGRQGACSYHDGVLRPVYG
ncbi:MAG TPA: hypothetical protein VJ851_06360 [Jatrophihabitans sp.]|nr:hypothetical protein [Jatrophihabitans sp.]